MRGHFRSRPVLALMLAIAACSYAPQPKDGEQQCFSGTDKQRCPDGYACAYNGYCYRDGHVPDVPGSGGGVVATGGSSPGSGGVITGRGGSGGVVTGRGGSGGSMTTLVLATGGSLGTGGILAAGGAGVGGVLSTGGLVGTGGSTTSPNTGTTVTFASYQAQGAMTGFGWIALGPLDSVSDPTCDDPEGPIVDGVPCAFTVWSSASKFCMTGYIPALPPNPTLADYSDNWGIEIGINATADGLGTLGQTFSSITVAVVATSPTSVLRILVHRKGDGYDVNYCASLTPGVKLLFTALNTACWDDSGTFLTNADVPNLDKVVISVPSGASAITVEDLCITRITFEP
jgi:hypothetical protein